MPEAVYLLCALMSAGCAFALLRTYVRRRTAILLWSSLCFLGLAVNNTLLFIDVVLLPASIDLSVLRAAVGASATMLLVVGLVWNVE